MAQGVVGQSGFGFSTGEGFPAGHEGARLGTHYQRFLDDISFRNRLQYPLHRKQGRLDRICAVARFRSRRFRNYGQHHRARIDADRHDDQRQARRVRLVRDDPRATGDQAHRNASPEPWPSSPPMTPPSSPGKPSWLTAAGDSLEILRRRRRPTHRRQEPSTAALRRVIALTAAPTGTRAMAYIFKESELPSLVSVVPGRERIFFVNQELASIDDMLAGVMHYKKGAASPLHLHKNCEHFYFIISGKATVESDEGIRPVGAGDLIFIPAEEKHRLRATEPLFYFEFQAPNRFKTTILEGTDDDLRWERKDGRVWVQT